MKTLFLNVCTLFVCVHKHVIEEEKIPAKISEISLKKLFSCLYIPGKFCYKSLK